MIAPLLIAITLPPQNFPLTDLRLGYPLPKAAPAGRSPRSFATGKYRNLFREIGKSDEQILAKLNMAWRQLFYGRDEDQRVYYPVGTNMAYIKDVGNNDVRSEGMSYGLMITVQLGRKDEFNRLWRWAKTYMQHQEGPWKSYFAWQCQPSGQKIAKVPASDGEEYFAMALLFADARWGSGKGIFNYRAEANEVLRAMLHKEKMNGGVVDGATNMFDPKAKQVVFVPSGDAATFTDASYHLPAFYELWAKWGPKEDRAFWVSAAQTSRRYFRTAVHPVTGLPSDYSSFAGKPMAAPWNPTGIGPNFSFDAYRVAGNIAMDYAWFGKDSWQVQQSNRYLNFFSGQKGGYVSSYTVDGKPLVDYRAGGHIAMNAVAALAATSPNAKSFVKELWDAPIPSGQWRYYDGMLYMFGLLHASGQYRIWVPKTVK